MDFWLGAILVRGGYRQGKGDLSSGGSAERELWRSQLASHVASDPKTGSELRAAKLALPVAFKLLPELCGPRIAEFPGSIKRSNGLLKIFHLEITQGEVVMVKPVSW